MRSVPRLRLSPQDVWRYFHFAGDAHDKVPLWHSENHDIASDASQKHQLQWAGLGYVDMPEAIAVSTLCN